MVESEESDQVDVDLITEHPMFCSVFHVFLGANVAPYSKDRTVLPEHIGYIVLTFLSIY